MADDARARDSEWDGKPSWSIVHSRSSNYAKERVKWEAFPTELGLGQRPYRFMSWPAMFYLAKNEDGGPVIAETRICDSEVQANLLPPGFEPTPGEAVDRLKAMNLEIAKLAAERNFEVRRMTPQAQAEVARFEAETDGHQPTVPPTPIARPGEHITSDREIRMQAEIDDLKALVTSALAPKPEVKKRGRPKKAKAEAVTE